MGLITDINYLKALTQYPCGTPDFTVVIETAFESAGPTLFSLLSFSCADIVKLRAGVSYRCGRLLKTLIRSTEPPKAFSKFDFVYKFVAPVETGLWYFFLAELAGDFAANWMSSLYQAEGCIPSDNDCHINGDNPAPGGLNPDQSHPIQYSYTSTVGNCQAPIFGGFSVPSGWFWSAFFDLDVEPFFVGGAVTVSLFIRRITPTQFDYPVHTFTPPWFGNNTQARYKISSQNRATHQADYQFAAIFSDWIKPNPGGTCAIIISEFPIIQPSAPGIGCIGHGPGLG